MIIDINIINNNLFADPRSLRYDFNVSIMSYPHSGILSRRVSRWRPGQLKRISGWHSPDFFQLAKKLLGVLLGVLALSKKNSYEYSQEFFPSQKRLLGILPGVFAPLKKHS
jgi:hypothetical protein